MLLKIRSEFEAFGSLGVCRYCGGVNVVRVTAMLSERVFAEASRRVVHELRGLECLARIRIASGR